MRQGIGVRQFFTSFRRRYSRKIFFHTIPAASALCSSVLAGAWMLNQRPAVTAAAARAPAAASTPAVASSPFGVLLVDMRLRSHVASIAQNSLLEPNLESFPPGPSAAIAEPESVRPTAAAPQLDQGAPLPPGRPAEFRWPTSYGGSPQAQAPHFAQQSRKTAPTAAPLDSRTLFEKVFGALQPSEPKPSTSALAYAAPESDALDRARKITSGPLLGYDRGTAVYDISAHTVHMPDGTKLEAHSGLGDKLDNPRYVHVKMRGATPPHIYELSLRERLFHGVRALRLTPAGGDGNIFGRAGLLAHTYMLGPRGDSNGCVVFKNYDAFLRAFQNGDIKRLAVVDRLGGTPSAVSMNR